MRNTLLAVLALAVSLAVAGFVAFDRVTEEGVPERVREWWKTWDTPVAMTSPTATPTLAPATGSGVPSEALEGYELARTHDGWVRVYGPREAVPGQLVDKAYRIEGFPVLQNGCRGQRSKVDWRSVDGVSVIEVYEGAWIHSQPEYVDGVSISEPGSPLQAGTRGTLILDGCAQPLFRLTPEGSVADVVVRYSEYTAVP